MSFTNPNEFTEDDAQIDKREQERLEFATTLAENGYPDVLVLSAERADRIYHPRTRAIIRYLNNNDSATATEISKNINYTCERRDIALDLKDLAEMDVIRTKEKHLFTYELAHDHIVMEPIA